MATGTPYTLADIYDSLNSLYAFTKEPYKGAIGRHGYLMETIAKVCRGRGILRYNGVPRNPEWKWTAALAPTKELARNILKDINKGKMERIERQRLRAAVNLLPPIDLDDEPEIINKPSLNIGTIPINTPVYEGTVKSSAKISPELINKLGDKFLVTILRQRGYTVTCTKTIEL